MAKLSRAASLPWKNSSSVSAWDWPNITRTLSATMYAARWNRNCAKANGHQKHPKGTDIVVDEFGARVVQKVFELYATASYSMDLLCQKLNVEHGIAWPRGYLGKLLSNPFYCGEMLLLRTRLRRTGRFLI